MTMTETPIAKLQRILREKAVSLDAPLTITPRRADLESKGCSVTTCQGVTQCPGRHR